MVGNDETKSIAGAVVLPTPICGVLHKSTKVPIIFGHDGEPIFAGNPKDVGSEAWEGKPMPSKDCACGNTSSIDVDVLSIRKRTTGATRSSFV